MKKIDKYFELYAGPYKINRVFGDATYELADCDNSNRIRGKFNVRQIKKYHEQKMQFTQGCENDISS